MSRAHLDQHGSEVHQAINAAISLLQHPGRGLAEDTGFAKPAGH